MKKTRDYLIAIHAICWLFFLSLPAVFVAGRSGITGIHKLLISPAWFYFTIYLLIFYLHTELLFPRLYFAKRYFLYFLSLLLLFTAVFYLRPFDRLAHPDKRADNWTELRNERLLAIEKQGSDESVLGKTQNELEEKEKREHEDNEPGIDIVSLILFFLIIAMSITIVVIKRWRIAVEQGTVAEAQRVNGELTLLKAQVNPHFLFNTLNNIYSMAVMQDKKTPESIMKLSNIMRYVTDEATGNFVPLMNETNFISDYVELQRLRLGSKVTLDFSINGNITDKIIAPLLLITFIENVFKYGISNNEPSTITINLRADADGIDFYCRNKSFPLKHQLEGTGIGIKNTRKRLEHLYPGKHALTIKDEDGYFSVHLILAP